MMCRMRSGLGAYSSTEGLNSALPSVSTYRVRIVQRRVHLVQVEQRQCGLVLKDGEVGLLLGRKLVEAQGAQPLLESGVKAALVVDGLGAEVIQRLVEALLPVFVQPDAGREGGGEGKYGVDELFREAGELLGRAFVAASGGDQQEGRGLQRFSPSLQLYR